MTSTTQAPSATLTYSNCPLPNALLVARESGLLAEAGIGLDLLTGAQGTTHFTYDRPDYTRFGGEIPPLLSEGLRAPGRTRLLGITRYAGRQGYYVPADSPVTEPADLAGRRIGVSGAAIRILRGDLGDYLDLDPWPQTLTALGSWEARALQHTLAAGGLPLDAVELVPIQNPWVDVPEQRLDGTASLRGTDLFTDAAGHQAAVLTGGEVDALFSWLAWGPELEARTGARLTLDLSTDAGNDYATLWTVSAELIEQRPEVVQALVDGVVAAGRWAAEHPAEVIAQHAANLGVAEASITAGFGPDFHRSLTPTLDDAALGLLSSTQTFLLDHRLLIRPVDLRQWAAPQFLTSATAHQSHLTPDRSTA